MADRYWVGGGSSTAWSATGPTNWGTASNTQDNASVPTTGDIVIFDGVGTGASNCTLNVSTSVLASVDFTGYANTLTHNASVNLNVGGNLTFASGMTYTLGSSTTSAIVLSSTWALTNAGKTTGNITVSGTGTVVDAINSTGTLTHSSGTLHLDGATDNSGLAHSILTVSVGSSGSFLMGTATYAISDSWLMSSINFSFSAGTSHITFSNTAPTTTFNTVTYYDVTFSGATTLSLNSTNSSSPTTFHNLSITGSAVKTGTVSLPNPITVTNQLTVNGNSSTNRLLFGTSSLGTASTVTVTGATVSTNNIDIRDVTFERTTAGGLDLTNGGANLIGDCGGNSRTGGDGTVTFTTPATQTYTGGTGSWSDVTKWTSRVPLPQDDVLMSGVTGGTITADMPRLGKSIDWTGASGTPTWNVDSVSFSIYGSLTLISAMSVTTGTTVTHTYEGRGSFTRTSAGKSFTQVANISMVGGTLTMQDAWAQGSNNTTVAVGTLVTNGYTFSGQLLTVSSGATLTPSTSTISLTGGFGVTIFNFSATATLTSNTATIHFTKIGANSNNTFAGGGKTYYDLKFSGGSALATAITGANTFNRIYTDGVGTKSITLPGSTTTTILSGQGLGNGTNVITFTSSAGTATLSKTTAGTLQWPYVNLTNIAATQTSKFYAPLSTDGGGNTNWIFGYAPVVGGVGTGRANRIAIGLMI